MCLCVCFCVSGTKHKTILEARSGLGPIKAYPRLGPKPIGEQGGGPVDPNTQERTFHCEICNVRVNSELQLKQVGHQELRLGLWVTRSKARINRLKDEHNSKEVYDVWQQSHISNYNNQT